MREDGHGKRDSFDDTMPVLEWRVAISLLRKTDGPLLVRIGRKMMNFLLASEIAEASEFLERYDEEIKGEKALGETNEPQEKASRQSLIRLSEEIFALASRHLPDHEILKQIQHWIHEEKSSFLIKPLMNVHSSLTDIADAMQRYQHFRPEEIEFSEATAKRVRVALLERVFTDQLSFIQIAKEHVQPDDFFEVLERIIYSAGSHGLLGGKAAGVFLGSKALRTRRLDVPEIGRVRTPKTWYLNSDGLHEFVNYNNIEDVYDQKYKEIEQVRREYPYVVQVFKTSHFPKETVKGLSMALDDFGKVPLIVRSSSLLEDRLGHAFSGKYKSLFLANQGSKKERLDALEDAIAEVYASTFSPDPIGYRVEHDLVDFDEQMAVMIQEVVGRRVGRYYFPAFAGVAFSANEYCWSPSIRRSDGLVRIVPGLGTRAVDRLTDDYPVLVSPGQPDLKVNVTPGETVRYAPRKMDVIDLEENCFKTVEVSRLLAECGDEYPLVHKIVSIYRDGQIQRPMALITDLKSDNLVVTFGGVIKDTPFIPQMAAILRALEECLKTPVDIEFAHDGKDLYLLQCRAQSRSKDEQPMRIPANVPPGEVLFSAVRHVPNGKVTGITHVVYVVPEEYGRLPDSHALKAVGIAVGKLNKLLPRRRFVLIGPGRWGSRGDVKLGVRVTYSDINNTAMLMEVARKKGDYVPDLSFGTHFFQDLVESSIRYLPLYPDDPGGAFNERFLLDAPNLLPGLLPESAALSDTLRVIDIPAVTGGKQLSVFMNGDEERALGFFAAAPGA